MKIESTRIGATDVDLCRAWTRAQIEAAVEALLARREAILPADPAARIVIKPNLNNDLVALTGNSTDLRVLGALVRALRRRGYTDLTIADGSNVGVDRRGIDSFKRLRVDRFCAALGVRLVNLNRDEGTTVVLHRGARPRVARTILEKGFLISVPKIKTHAEMQLSCAMKNWLGIAVGQDKRQVHYDLGRNIHALNELIRPDLVLVDGLVGMEGNGPGDGEPVRLGVLVCTDDALANDLYVCRLAGVDWRRVPYLAEAGRRGQVSGAMEQDLALVPLLRRLEPPPPRSLQARLSEKSWLIWLKLAVRPLVDRPVVARLAYRLRIVQDVYDRTDDSLRVVGRDPARCGDCQRCAEICPQGLAPERIGEREACLQCLYCWFVCPEQAITVEGEARQIARQVERYGGVIRGM
ncbi:MAG: DUF362 domain-containing protein [Pseudomonadota bacterium]